MAKTKKQNSIVDDDFIAEIEEIFALPCDGGGFCPGKACSDYGFCTNAMKLPDSATLQYSTVVCIPVDLLDARRAMLDDFCDNAGLTVARSRIITTAAPIQGATRVLDFMAHTYYHVYAKGVSGCKRQVELKISLNPCEKAPRIYAVGFPIGIAPREELIEIAKNHILYAGNNNYSYLQFPVREQLRGAWIDFDCLSFNFYGEFSVDDALLLCTYCRQGTLIHGTQEIEHKIRAAKTLQGK